MGQLISIFIAFLFIPILIRLKFKLSYTLLISAGILGLLSGIGLEKLGYVVLSVFSDFSSRTTILTVMMVSILGGLMKHYMILDKVVETILLVIRNKKNALIIIPAMIGILVIPGGALLSAPFINDIGKEMDIPDSRRAAINLVFRHIAMFLLPYSTSLLLVAATLPNLNIFKLILFNLFFVIAIVIAGYFIFLKDIKSETLAPRKNIVNNLLELALFTSPIYIAVIINAITGLPFHITLIASVIIVYILGDKKNFFKVFIESLNWGTVLTVVAVLIMKEIILNMEGLLALFNNMFSLSSGLSMLGIFLISSIFFGYITGNINTSLAIILPMISQLNITGNLLYVYTYFIFGTAFIGYYFSPLHLCQAFTLEHIGVTTGELYREYKIYAPALLLILIISTFIFKILFA